MNLIFINSRINQKSELTTEDGMIRTSGDCIRHFTFCDRMSEPISQIHLINIYKIKKFEIQKSKYIYSN